jgi:hypothetical protein
VDKLVNKPVCVCPYLGSCGLVETLREKMAELSQRIYDNYCTKKGSPCARFRLYKNAGADAVPPLMLPGQISWAEQILAELGKTESAVAEKTEVR